MRTGAGLYIYNIYNIKQVRLPDHPVWRFVGRGHNWRSLCPLHIIEVLHLYRWNTHTPRRSGADEVTMKVRWQWKWNEQYLTRTRRGEHKRRGTERTPTRHTWPGTGKPWKGKGKEKRRPTDNGTRPAEGGKDGSAWTNLTRREPTPTLAREGPNLPEEGRTQEHIRKGTHGGLVDEDASTLSCKVPSLRLNGPDSSHPHRRLT